MPCRARINAGVSWKSVLVNKKIAINLSKTLGLQEIIMGFSFYSLLVTILIMLPNLLFVIFPPKNLPAQLRDGGTLLNIMEHGGRIVFFGLFLFTATQTQPLKFSLFWALTIFFLLCYFALWIRYFRSQRDFRLLMDNVYRIPVPMAVFPILALLFAALWLKAYLSIPALACFAIGHVTNSLITEKQLRIAH